MVGVRLKKAFSEMVTDISDVETLLAFGTDEKLKGVILAVMVVDLGTSPDDDLVSDASPAAPGWTPEGRVAPRVVVVLWLLFLQIGETAGGPKVPPQGCRLSIGPECCRVSPENKTTNLHLIQKKLWIKIIIMNSIWITARSRKANDGLDQLSIYFMNSQCIISLELKFEKRFFLESFYINFC